MTSTLINLNKRTTKVDSASCTKKIGNHSVETTCSHSYPSSIIANDVIPSSKNNETSKNALCNQHNLNRQIIDEYMNSKLKVNDIQIVVPSQQWNDFLQIVDKNSENLKESEKMNLDLNLNSNSNFSVSQSINNCSLLEENKLDLRRDVIEKRDFYLLPEKLWNLIEKNYEIEVSPKICRRVVERGQQTNVITVIDLYPTLFFVCSANTSTGNPNNEFDLVQVSKSQSMTYLIDQFKDKFFKKEESEDSSYRIQIAFNSADYEDGKELDDKFNLTVSKSTSNNVIHQNLEKIKQSLLDSSQYNTTLEDLEDEGICKLKSGQMIMIEASVNNIIEAGLNEGEESDNECNGNSKSNILSNKIVWSRKTPKNIVGSNVANNAKTSNFIENFDGKYCRVFVKNPKTNEQCNAKILDTNGNQIFVEYVASKKKDQINLSSDSCRVQSKNEGNSTNTNLQSTSTGFQSRFPTYGSYNSSFTNSPNQKGAVGLRNLGNTCFMNSTLQCLSNTPFLTEYFLSDKQRSEINATNPLGRNGKIAFAWANLVHELQSGRHLAVAPRSLKCEVGNFAPRFLGYSQQDSSEFLQFLLDGLHEDLNRIYDKPSTEPIEANGRLDSVVAKESQINYKKRNDSIIVDTTHGQLKSTLICPSCNYVSITFDPFLFLSVPFPQIRDQIQLVRLVFNDTSRPHMIYAVRVEKTFKIGFLKQEISNFSGISHDNLVICSIYNRKISHKYLENDEEIETSSFSLTRSHDFLWAYEIFKIPNKIFDLKIESFSFCNIEQYFECENQENFLSSSLSDDKFNFSHTKPFAFPLIISLPEYSTLEEIKKIFEEFLKPCINFDEFDTFNECNQESNMNIDKNNNNSSSDKDLVNNRLKMNMPYKILMKDYYDNVCDLNESESLNNEDTKQNRKIDTSFLCFAIVWKSPKYFNSNLFRETQYHDSVPDRLRNASSSLQTTSSKYFNNALNFRNRNRLYSDSSKTVNLSDCIDAFTMTERLSEQDAWYCRNCKTHRRATKKFDLQFTPKILIISLKRFVYTHAYRNRINTPVNFPARGLDLSPQIVNKDKNESSNISDSDAIYDLYAISNHIGGMGGGHYTAHCKNLINGKQYNFDDSLVTEFQDMSENISSSSAYVLYYCKRDSKYSDFENNIKSVSLNMNSENGIDVNQDSDDDNKSSSSDIISSSTDNEFNSINETQNEGRNNYSTIGSNYNGANESIYDYNDKEQDVNFNKIYD